MRETSMPKSTFTTLFEDSLSKSFTIDEHNYGFSEIKESSLFKSYSNGNDQVDNNNTPVTLEIENNHVYATNGGSNGVNGRHTHSESSDPETNEKLNDTSSIDTSHSTEHENFTNIIRQKYMLDYNLNDHQYDLIKGYFDRLQRDGLLKVDILKQHMFATIENTANLSATRENILSTCELIDNDGDRLLDMSDFIDYLTLFFANKYNLRAKIQCFLNGHRFSHSNVGFLNQKEASGFLEFLKKFYNVEPTQTNNNNNDNQEDDSSPEEAEVTRSFSPETEISYEEFTIIAYPMLVDNVFVNF